MQLFHVVELDYTAMFELVSRCACSLRCLFSPEIVMTSALNGNWGYKMWIEGRRGYLSIPVAAGVRGRGG